MSVEIKTPFHWAEQWAAIADQVFGDWKKAGMPEVATGDALAEGALKMYRAIQIDALQYASRLAQRKKMEFDQLCRDGTQPGLNFSKRDGCMEVEGAIVAAIILLEQGKQPPPADAPVEAWNDAINKS